MKTYTVRLGIEENDVSCTFTMKADDNPDIAHEEICNYVFGHITVDSELYEGDSGHKYTESEHQIRCDNEKESDVGSDYDGLEY